MARKTTILPKEREGSQKARLRDKKKKGKREKRERIGKRRKQKSHTQKLTFGGTRLPQEKVLEK